MSTIQTAQYPYQMASSDLGKNVQRNVQTKLESSKNFLMKTQHRAQFYWSAFEATMKELWQQQDFRLACYIFGSLTAIPLGIFLAFISGVMLFATVTSTFIWSFFVFSAIAVGLVGLLPVLFGFFVTTVIIMSGYYAYKYLMSFRKQNKLRAKQN
ncbi:hypothetical protein BDF20DRAFT_887980 [Mycotypha africana]|uniref:uncharacterized protein n=1 Tax=Mycotypha africana TaxID=64632 RepID=UPI0023017A5E|nr:uncharacterized protein BDF20DRAFT_887980 [Mycotypha africana]KAI8972016.1 hypothetical protein BDF20DRAFT_887980 [Mycotypha africana]